MKSDMMKWLLLVLLFPLCDFVFYFLSDALGEEPAKSAEAGPSLRDSARQAGSRGQKQSAGRRKFTQRGGTAAAAFEGLWSQ